MEKKKRGFSRLDLSIDPVCFNKLASTTARFGFSSCITIASFQKVNKINLRDAVESSLY